MSQDWHLVRNSHWKRFGLVFELGGVGFRESPEWDDIDGDWDLLPVCSCRLCGERAQQRNKFASSIVLRELLLQSSPWSQTIQFCLFSLALFELLALSWSQSKWEPQLVSLCTGPWRGTPETTAALRVTQTESLLISIARCFGEIFSLALVVWSGEPGIGLDFLVPQQAPPQPILHLCPSYQSWCGFFFISSV